MKIKTLLFLSLLPAPSMHAADPQDDRVTSREPVCVVGKNGNEHLVAKICPLSRAELYLTNEKTQETSILYKIDCDDFGDISAVTWSEDGRYLVAAINLIFIDSYRGGAASVHHTQFIQIWDCKTGQPLARRSIRMNRMQKISELQWLPDDTLHIFGTYEGKPCTKQLSIQDGDIEIVDLSG